MTMSKIGSETTERMPRWTLVALSLAALWFSVTHCLQLFTEAINWDEFALLARADRMHRLGEFVTGGRPGLVVLALIPFVKDCTDSVIAVVNARIAWLLPTFGYLAGVGLLIRRWYSLLGRPEEGTVQGIVTVALLAFLPAFVSWSVQVRTDQVAIAAAVWGGVLLQSRGRLQAAGAGILFGIGLLCSQKAAYVILLSGLMYFSASMWSLAGAAASTADRIKSASIGLVIAAVAATAVVAVYLTAVPSATGVVTGRGLSAAIDTMNWVRATQGYRAYLVHLPRLVVHWMLLAVLIVWLANALVRRDRVQLPIVGTAVAILALGALVARFHGSTFPYFIMTLGLFPCVALGMAAGWAFSIGGRLRWIALSAFVWLAALQSSRESLEMLQDTQETQRATMRIANALVDRGFRGYSVEGALFCARDPDPIPTMFSQDIWRRFKDSPKAATDFVSDLRARPLAFFIESYRLNQFPSSVRQFFRDHYVWYGSSVFVAGFELPPHMESRTIDVLVDGSYQWVAQSGFAESTVTIDGIAVTPGQSISLTRGTHELKAMQSPAAGALILGEVQPDIRIEYPAFYSLRQILQLGGNR